MSFLINYLIKKTKFLFGDFNINLINYHIHPPTYEYLDSISFDYFFLYVPWPSRVTSNLRTLIDVFF